MTFHDNEYLSIAKKILEEGNEKWDRTNTGTKSVFGVQMRFDLSSGFPLLTTKKVPFRLIASELLWFLKGDTNIQYLLKHNNHIWDEWPFRRYVQSKEYVGPDMTDFNHRAQQDEVFRELYKKEKNKFCKRIVEDDEFAEKWGSIGPAAYGAQWRSYTGPDNETTDQIKQVIHDIKHNPDSRRLIVNSWNPVEIQSGKALLPPCHVLFQFYVHNNTLSCQLYQRSGDYFLGIPFNIASYSLLTHLIAKETNLGVGEFIHNIGDAHIYNNHIEQIKEQLGREPYKSPKLVIDSNKSLFSMELEDFKIQNYKSCASIKAPVAV